MGKLKEGFVQVYTGNGKGKTTAALGQAIRAAGAGLKTYIIQFMKEYPYSELTSLKHLSEWITIEQKGNDDFVYKKELPSEAEKSKARESLKMAQDLMLSQSYNLIILDEVLVTVYFKLLTTEEIISVIKNKPAEIELILTGRYCPDEIIATADLVTEMKEVKHYYTKGILSRKGIES
ncbi:MAG TPA: cob(I)yrinic acid a,c-diamide adenosyltransferase [Ignavibacteriaceae bacterium]|nr:cob(I)yrinic acid a,c-diamide adenosyltransferase [Ignavibacteriaceae bacterium]